MANEPSRNELEQFLITQYNLLAKQSKETNLAGLAVGFRGAQIAHASTLFYMRTGLNHLAEPQKFKEFMHGLDGGAGRQ